MELQTSGIGCDLGSGQVMSWVRIGLGRLGHEFGSDGSKWIHVLGPKLKCARSGLWSLVQWGRVRVRPEANLDSSTVNAVGPGHRRVQPEPSELYTITPLRPS